MNDTPREEAEQLAQRFHEAYERLAPRFGYETREASRKPWHDVPEQNRRLMVAVCAEVMREAVLREQRVREGLARYGKHEPGCASQWRAATGSSQIGPCDCGLASALLGDRETP